MSDLGGQGGVVFTGSITLPRGVGFPTRQLLVTRHLSVAYQACTTINGAEPQIVIFASLARKGREGFGQRPRPVKSGRTPDRETADKLSICLRT